MFGSTLSDHAQKTLALLGKSGLVNQAYLAGGSALALHFGHRYSIDFDFFTPISFFSSDVVRRLKKIGSFIPQTVLKNTLLGSFNQVKFSLFLYKYPLVFSTHKFL